MTTLSAATELVRPIRARPLAVAEVTIVASPDECAALAERFELVAVERLEATIALEAEAGAVRANGRLSAQIIQTCAVSGEDLPAAINEPITLRFVEARPPREIVAGEEIELEAEDCDLIEYEGEMFDLGEAVAQSLGLAIDPYAVGPAAAAARKAAGIMQEGEAQGPLAAALAALLPGAPRA